MALSKKVRGDEKVEEERKQLQVAAAPVPEPEPPEESPPEPPPPPRARRGSVGAAARNGQRWLLEVKLQMAAAERQLALVSEELAAEKGRRETADARLDAVEARSGETARPSRERWQGPAPVATALPPPSTDALPAGVGVLQDALHNKLHGVIQAALSKQRRRKLTQARPPSPHGPSP